MRASATKSVPQRTDPRGRTAAAAKTRTVHRRTTMGCCLHRVVGPARRPATRRAARALKTAVRIEGHGRPPTPNRPTGTPQRRFTPGFRSIRREEDAPAARQRPVFDGLTIPARLTPNRCRCNGFNESSCPPCAVDDCFKKPAALACGCSGSLSCNRIMSWPAACLPGCADLGLHALQHIAPGGLSAHDVGDQCQR